jgi:hypothetical protein
MKHHWQVRRQMRPVSDGARRWDRAYMLILSWGPAAKGSQPAEESAASRQALEVSHEDGCLRACLDPATGPGPDH